MSLYTPITNNELTMQLIPVIVTAALSFSAGVSAWAQAANGEWIAHNTFELIQGRKHISEVLR